MTNDTSQSDPEARQAAWIAQYQDHARRAAEAWPANKAVLFDALARAGITSVIVNFDGYGDSGQIEQVEVRAGDATAELPAHQIEFVDPVLRRSAKKSNDRRIPSAMRSRPSSMPSSSRPMAGGRTMTAPLATSPSTSGTGRSRSTTTSGITETDYSCHTF